MPFCLLFHLNGGSSQRFYKNGERNSESQTPVYTILQNKAKPFRFLVSKNKTNKVLFCTRLLVWPLDIQSHLITVSDTVFDFY